MTLADIDANGFVAGLLLQKHEGDRWWMSVQGMYAVLSPDYVRAMLAECHCVKAKLSFNDEWEVVHGGPASPIS